MLWSSCMVSRLLAYLHVSEEAVLPKVLFKGLAGLTTNEALAHVVFLNELFVLTQVDELINGQLQKFEEKGPEDKTARESPKKDQDSRKNSVKGAAKDAAKSPLKDGTKSNKKLVKGML